MNARRRPCGRRALLWIGLLLWAAAGPSVELELIGEVRLPTGTMFGDTEVGGLSGLSYDAVSGRFFAVSDDRSIRSPARFYTLELDLDSGRLEPDGLRIVGVTTLRDENGELFRRGRLDPEGIALAPDGSLFISSEGDTSWGVAPFVRRFSIDGRQLESLHLPEHYFAGPDGPRGIRDNLGFEGLTTAPGWPTLFVACESAFLQDGPSPDLTHGALTRILEIDLASRRPVREYVYATEPVPFAPALPGGHHSNGLSDILAVDGRLLITLERSYVVGHGNTVRLFLASLDRASNVLQRPSLREAGDLSVVRKRPLTDLAELGITPDNIEGLSLGPRLPDGRQSLILVSDNNFKEGEQVTQFLAFALSGLAAERRSGVSIAEIQGEGHTSLYADQWLDGVTGVVTAVREGRRAERRVWLQEDDDGELATSSALRVAVSASAPELAVGDRIAVSGRVEERGYRNELSVTRMVAFEVTVLERGVDLPAPVILGRGGRALPRDVIDNDGLAVFDPLEDAIDFYESLESMRVAIGPGAVVVGPTSQHGVVAVLSDGGLGSAPRSERGALVITPGDLNPERLLLDDELLGEMPALPLGVVLPHAVEGILDYGFGAFRIHPSGPLPPPQGAPPVPERSRLGEREGLRVATMNLENFSFLAPENKVLNLARDIVEGLGAPQILALQEVQDDTGRSDDGVVSADRTLARLVEAVTAAGGPRYAWRQIDPEDGADGGAPGANIRVAFLYDPRSVRFVERGTDCTEARIEAAGTLGCSPARLAPGHPAFGGDPERHFYGSRKSLVGEFAYRGRRLILINNHLSSKIGDDPPFGDHQPPWLRTEVQRHEQTRVIAGFVRRILTADPEARVVVLGDFNEFAFQAPLRELEQAGLVNLLYSLPEREHYTYIHEGNAQALDHIFVSPTLAVGAELDIVHRHSEYPASARPSDHDPVVVRFAP